MRRKENSAAELHFLDDESLEFDRAEGGFLSLTYGRTKYDRVYVYRSFPLSFDEAFISVRDRDDRELGIIRSLSSLSRASRAVVEEELDARYFTPLIERIVSLKEEFGFVYWDVDTTAGRCRITTEMGHNAVLPLEGKRILVTDVDGNRYEMADYSAVSPAHFRIIELLI